MYKLWTKPKKIIKTLLDIYIIDFIGIYFQLMPILYKYNKY